MINNKIEQKIANYIDTQTQTISALKFITNSVIKFDDMNAYEINNLVSLLNLNIEKMEQDLEILEEKDEKNNQ